MNIISDIDSIEKTLKNPVLTIGNFDGVHKGHLSLFDKVKERARAINGDAAVMTFEPHPIKVTKPGNGPPLITLIEQKLNLMWDAGLDAIFCLPFDKEFATVRAEDFIENILIHKIGIKEIVVGYDYSFGHKRGGNIDLLKTMGKDLGFKVHVVEPIYIDDMLVSSTSIRNLVQEGNLSDAKLLLGRNYQVGGTVITGQGRGSKELGFPTANLNLIDELIPMKGVYAVTVLIDGILRSGVTNIGHNPTFGANALSVETHVLDFNLDLLGKTIKINFIQRLRSEKKFEGIDALSAQINQDIADARKIFEKLKS